MKYAPAYLLVALLAVLVVYAWKGGDVLETLLTALVGAFIALLVPQRS